MKKSVLLVSLVATCMILGPSATGFAHHSVQNNYDVTKTVKKSGLLKKIDWTNPHAWFHFTEVDENGKPVVGPDGKEITWSLETTGPGGLRRLGIADRRLFEIGKQYSFSGYPDRTGDTKMFTLQIKFPDGRTVTIGFPEGAPAL